MFILLDKTELETAQQFLDQASQQNLVCITMVLYNTFISTVYPMQLTLCYGPVFLFIECRIPVTPVFC